MTTIESWNDIPKTAIVRPVLVNVDANVRTFGDQRRRANRFVFSVTYMGAEFRKTLETRRTDVQMPGELTRGQFDEWFRSVAP